MGADGTCPRQCSEIVALDRRARAGILAVVYESGRPRRTVRLPDGTAAETLDPDQRLEAPESPPEILAVATDGGPATVHHANLGLVVAHVALSGVFLLSSGEVAAVYGAEVIPLG
jgi:hypothetical protein